MKAVVFVCRDAVQDAAFPYVPPGNDALSSVGLAPHHLVTSSQAQLGATAPVGIPVVPLLIASFPPPAGRCRPFTRSWWGSSASASCCSTTPSTRTQSGENRPSVHVFSQGNCFLPRVDVAERVASTHFNQLPVLVFSFYRGDPTWVKINVAITTGYLISGKKHWPAAGIVTPKSNKCVNYPIG